MFLHESFREYINSSKVGCPELLVALLHGRHICSLFLKTVGNLSYLFFDAFITQ